MKDLEIVIQDKSESFTLKEMSLLVDYFNRTNFANRIYGVCKSNGQINILDCFGEKIDWL